MGMFDTLYCEFDLPDKSHNSLEFQTKSLHNCLDRYVIRHDGTLIHKTIGLFGEDGDPSKEVVMNHFSGLILFYTSLAVPGKECIWVEYEALYDTGRLLWIRPFVPRMP